MSGLYTAQDVIVALREDRIRAKGWTPETLAEYCEQPYMSPTLLGLMWDYSDRLDEAAEMTLTLAGTTYHAWPSLSGPGYLLGRTGDRHAR